jgi:hypothetical protein
MFCALIRQSEIQNDLRKILDYDGYLAGSTPHTGIENKSFSDSLE